MHMYKYIYTYTSYIHAYFLLNLPVVKVSKLPDSAVLPGEEVAGQWDATVPAIRKVKALAMAKQIHLLSAVSRPRFLNPNTAPHVPLLKVF